MYVVSDISETSNSSPRTMRRNASMSGSTSTNSNSKVRGLTVRSLRALLFPCVRVTVFSLSSGMGALHSPEGRHLSPVSCPWHERCVNHARHPLATDRSDRKVHLVQPKLVRRDLLQREALRRSLLKGELARLEAVPARTLDRDGFRGDSADRKIREFRHVSLHDHGPAS